MSHVLTLLDYELVAVGHQDARNTGRATPEQDPTRLPRVGVDRSGGAGEEVRGRFELLRRTLPRREVGATRVVIEKDGPEVEQQRLRQRVAGEMDKAELPGPPDTLGINPSTLGPRVSDDARLDP